MKTIQDLKGELNVAKEERRRAKAKYDVAVRECNKIAKELYERFLSEDTARLDLIDVGATVMMNNVIANLPVYFKDDKGKFLFTSLFIAGLKSKLRNFYSRNHEGVKVDDRAVALVFYEYSSNDLKKDLTPVLRILYDEIRTPLLKKINDALFTRDNAGGR